MWSDGVGCGRMGLDGVGCGRMGLDGVRWSWMSWIMSSWKWLDERIRDSWTYNSVLHQITRTTNNNTKQ